jgi:hypothetical protein
MPDERLAANQPTTSRLAPVTVRRPAQVAHGRRHRHPGVDGRLHPEPKRQTAPVRRGAGEGDDCRAGDHAAVTWPTPRYPARLLSRLMKIVAPDCANAPNIGQVRMSWRAAKIDGKSPPTVTTSA